jgi:hypothetical protein
MLQIALLQQNPLTTNLIHEILKLGQQFPIPGRQELDLEAGVFVGGVVMLQTFRNI